MIQLNDTHSTIIDLDNGLISVSFKENAPRSYINFSYAHSSGLSFSYDSQKSFKEDKEKILAYLLTKNQNLSYM